MPSTLNRQFLFISILLIQIIIAYPNNDHYIKINDERTFPKKYSSMSSVNNKNNNNNNNNNVKLRHASSSSSKFPHFDQFKTRLADLNSDSNSKFSDNNNNNNKLMKSVDTKWAFSTNGHRLRHHGWTNRVRLTTTTTTTTTTTPSPDEDLFNNYGELLDRDEEEQPDNENADDIFNFSDDGNEDEYIDDDIQAEEAPSAATQKSTLLSSSSLEPAHQQQQQQSSFSNYKWKHFGTKKAVEEERNSYIKYIEDSRTAAIEHYKRVKNSCKKPIPKVISVQQEHPDSSVTYIPQCTELHRCAEDTGCCSSDKICQYKKKVEVDLYFYMKPLGETSAQVVKLKFYNHTECECGQKKSFLQSNEEINVTTTTERLKRVADNHHQNNQYLKLKSLNSINAENRNNNNNNPASLLKKCKCPKEFTPKIKYNSKCYCDCEIDNEDCSRMKKGKEYNSLIDRICIQKKECGTVICEYGSYNKLIGRCPRYDET